MYDQLKLGIAKEIYQAERIALTTDLWTSAKQIAFMVITAHYVSPEAKLMKRIIFFKVLNGSHTGFAIAEQLLSTIAEWKAMDKVAFMTVDNASSNDVAMRRVQSVLNSQPGSGPDMDGQYFHVRCSAHVINLVVKDGLQTTCTAIDKLRESTRYIKLTPARKESFLEALKMSNTTEKAWPSVDVPTRWNSTYQMIRSSLPYQSAYASLAIHDTNYIKCPSEAEWIQLKTMAKFLEIFETGKSLPASLS
jgi:hypothetical protein